MNKIYEVGCFTIVTGGRTPMQESYHQSREKLDMPHKAKIDDTNSKI